MKTLWKPAEGEYPPYAAGYVSLVPDDGRVLEHMQSNLQVVKDLMRAQSEEKLIERCAEGEWTIKEILVHVIDGERVFVYRALRFARNDATELAGFEQNMYVPYTGANHRTIEDILEELTAVRMASIAFFNSLDEAAWKRSGLANGSKMTVQAAAYIVVGHELHHLESIKENYLS